MTVEVTLPAPDELPTVLLVPREVTGASSLPATANPDGSRTISFTPRGAYSLEIAASAPRLTGC